MDADIGRGPNATQELNRLVKYDGKCIVDIYSFTKLSISGEVACRMDLLDDIN